jgi:hypothetical protein
MGGKLFGAVIPMGDCTPKLAFWLGLPDLIPEVSFRLRRKIIGLSSRCISRTVEARIIFVALLDRRESQAIVFMTTERFT